MKKIIINRNSLIVGIILWWLVFAALSITHFNNFQILNIIGFIFLALVPGMLTVFSLKLKEISFWATLSMSVAFSLLELMVMGLVGNFFLPKFGITQPLAQNILIIEMSILILALSLIAWRKLSDWKINIGETFREIFPSKLDTWLSLFPILFVAQSIIGALSLNNGGSGLWTLAMLGEIAVYVLILYIYVKKIDENTIPIAFYFIGLALLLMTSLRGWHVTGHDIQQEYKVFELTKNAGFWNMDFYRDAYNACLSITILPTIFFNLLKVSDPYIFKFFFQFFFALSAGIAYLISRHWVNKQIAFLAAFYFIAFPTFFIDMPFLIRQEIAFIFYGLMLYIIFERKLNIKIRRLLFILMGIGVILSHYSTTYTILLIFGLVVVSRPIFIRLLKIFEEKWNLFSNSPLGAISKTEVVDGKVKITFIMIIILFITTFLWTSTITNTGGHLIKVLKETVYAAVNGLTENNRSTDAVNLLNFRKPNQQQELENYIEKILNPIRKKAPPGVYFDELAYKKYNFVALPDEQMPLTKLGYFTQKFDINFILIITLFGRVVAKFMQILVPLGILYILLYKSSIKYIDDEFYLMTLYSIIFIFLIIIIPVLSTEYGIYRAMQQAMFILALPIVLGSLWIGSWIKYGKQQVYYLYFKVKKIKTQTFSNTHENIFPIVLVLLFFLYSTSFILQIFGKNPAILYLSNTGRYYDNYLIKTTEVSAVSWLSTITDKKISGLRIQIQTDRYTSGRIASLTSMNIYNDIFPGIVRKDSYVYLGKANTTKQRATLVYGGDQITYTYPVQFLDDNKNLIYNNGEAKIYK